MIKTIIRKTTSTTTNYNDINNERGIHRNNDNYNIIVFIIIIIFTLIFILLIILHVIAIVIIVVTNIIAIVDVVIFVVVLRTLAPIATAHPYSARKFTCHVMHRARALSTKMNNTPYSKMALINMQTKE